MPFRERGFFAAVKRLLAHDSAYAGQRSFLRELPDDVVALFVGAPIQGRDYMVDQFKEWAVRQGVEDRVRFTGYVSEEVLEQVLPSVDGYGGGHEQAVGACIKEDDFEKFLGLLKEAVGQ